MSKIGNKRSMMPDTTLATPKSPDVGGSNLNIQEEQIFDKSKKEPKKTAEKPVSLEITTLGEEPPDHPPEIIEPVKPKKRTNRQMMTPERAAEVKAERTARLVEARKKSLEKRRQGMYQKAIAKGEAAKSKLGKPESPLKKMETIQEIPTPQGFSSETPTLPVKVPEGFAKPRPPQQQSNHVDYDKIVNGVWDKFNNYNSKVDDQALHAYGEQIRKEEAAKSRASLQLEYQKIEQQKAQFKNMKNSLNVLGGGAGRYRPNHRVFGANKPRKILPTTPSNNPFDQCFH